MWVCIVSVAQKEKGGLGVMCMCAVLSAWIEEQTNETVDYMSGLAGFPKNTRHTVFSVRSLWSRCVTICSG